MHFGQVPLLLSVLGQPSPSSLLYCPLHLFSQLPKLYLQFFCRKKPTIIKMLLEDNNTCTNKLVSPNWSQKRAATQSHSTGKSIKLRPACTQISPTRPQHVCQHRDQGKLLFLGHAGPGWSKGSSSDDGEMNVFYTFQMQVPGIQLDWPPKWIL